MAREQRSVALQNLFQNEIELRDVIRKMQNNIGALRTDLQRPFYTPLGKLEAGAVIFAAELTGAEDAELIVIERRKK